MRERPQWTPPDVVRVGGPCTCKPGRYVRFAIPPGVPGCEPMISCRANHASEAFLNEHAIPPGVEIQIHVASLEGSNA